MPDPQSRRPVSVVAATVRSANAVPPSSQPCSAQQSPSHLRRSHAPPSNRRFVSAITATVRPAIAPSRLRHGSHRPPRNRCPAVIAAIAIRRIDLFPSFDSPGRDRTTSARSAQLTRHAQLATPGTPDSPDTHPTSPPPNRTPPRTPRRRPGTKKAAPEGTASFIGSRIAGINNPAIWKLRRRSSAHWRGEAPASRR